MKWIKGLMTAVAFVGLASTAHAAAVTGFFTMMSPNGGILTNTSNGLLHTPVTGNITNPADPSTVTVNTFAFFGLPATAFNVTAGTPTGADTAVDLLFAWSAFPSIPVHLDWNLNTTSATTGLTSQTFSLAMANTGVPLTQGFPGFLPNFNLNVVPEPMSMALVGSALVGLVGLRRRFQA